MSQVINFPYHQFLQELQISTQTLQSLLAGISPTAARQKPNAEDWSILEVLCHLYDEEREDFREHLDFILHRQQEEWHKITPQEWVTERNYNGQDFTEMREKFFAEREKSLVWLRQLSGANWHASYQNQYGTTSAAEMLACWLAHDNLHIRQLVQLRRAWLETITTPYNLEYAGEW